MSYRLKAHIWLPIWLLWTDISLFRTVFEIFDVKFFRVWPWPLTPRGHLGSKQFIPLESPWYDLLFDFYGQDLSILYRFRDIRLQSHLGFDLDLWPLTGHLEVKKCYTIRKSIYDLLFDFYGQHLSDHCTVFEIFDLKVFRVFDLWSLTPRGHLGSRTRLYRSKAHIWLPMLTDMDNISLSRTVFEIFDVKVFRVWPWPLTPEGHLGSKNLIPFESPYMICYLTSMDKISLSRTVFEIFDFKVFRVLPWPLTPKGHLGSKKIMPFESPYMTSYLISMYNISLSRTVFEIFDVKVFRVWPWPLWPLKVIWGQKILYHSKVHIWLAIWLLWTRS